MSAVRSQATPWHRIEHNRTPRDDVSFEHARNKRLPLVFIRAPRPYGRHSSVLLVLGLQQRREVAVQTLCWFVALVRRSLWYHWVYTPLKQRVYGAYTECYVFHGVLSLQRLHGAVMAISSRCHGVVYDFTALSLAFYNFL